MKDKVHLRVCEGLYSAPSLTEDELQPACTVTPQDSLGCATAHPAHRERPRRSLSLSPPAHPLRAPGTCLPTRPPPAPRPAAEPSEPALARPYPASPAPGSAAGPRRSYSNNAPKAEQSAGPRMRTERNAGLSAAAILAPSASRRPFLHPGEEEGGLRLNAAAESSPAL